METDERIDANEIPSKMASKTCRTTTTAAMKHAPINKFLSKTYQMIDQCDATIATWSSGGDSFIIKDVDAFGKTVLPLYFKHSKFSSFIRQLNFYSFRKLRVIGDDSEQDSIAATPRGRSSRRKTTSGSNSSKKSVRFMHPYFQKNHPELLHRIQRSTKSLDSPSVEMVKLLRHEVVQMNQQLDDLSSHVDHKLAKMTSIIEADFQVRMKNLAVLYQALSNTCANIKQPELVSSLQTSPSPITSSNISTTTLTGATTIDSTPKTLEPATWESHHHDPSNTTDTMSTLKPMIASSSPPPTDTAATEKISTPITPTTPTITTSTCAAPQMGGLPSLQQREPMISTMKTAASSSTTDAGDSRSAISPLMTLSGVAAMICTSEEFSTVDTDNHTNGAIPSSSIACGTTKVAQVPVPIGATPHGFTTTPTPTISPPATTLSSIWKMK